MLELVIKILIIIKIKLFGQIVFGLCMLSCHIMVFDAHCTVQGTCLQSVEAVYMCTVCCSECSAMMC